MSVHKISITPIVLVEHLADATGAFLKDYMLTTNLNSKSDGSSNEASMQFPT